MLQKNSFFKAAWAAALTLGAFGVANAAFPAAADMDGEYNFTANVEYTSDATSVIKQVLPDNFNFNIGNKCTTLRNFDLGNNTVDLVKYNEDLGTITMTSNHIGSVGGFGGDGVANQLGITTLDGKWSGAGECVIVWQVSQNGAISIPDFAVVDFSKPTIPIVATFTNVKVTSTKEPAAPTYPSLDEITGYYKFTSSDFTLYEDNNTTLKGEFNFTISNEDGILKVSHFLYNNFQLGTGLKQDRADYDPATGILTFQSYTVTENTATLYGIAPGGVWNGFSNPVLLTFQFQPDGYITIPDFQLVKFSGANVLNVVAEYSENRAVKADPFGDDNDGPIVSNPAIEGIWTINCWDIMLEGSESITPAEYYATLKGNVVTFEEQGSGNAAGRPGTYHIIGKFTSPTTILVQRAIVGDGNIANPLYQVPFTNGKKEYSANPTYLNDESWTLTYDPVAGTLTPPEGNNGLYYANFAWETTTMVNTIQGAFIFSDGKKVSDFVPTIEIANLKPVTSGNSVTVTFDVTLERFDGITPAKWEAEITQYFSDIEAEKDWTEHYTVPCTVSNGKGTITLTGLQGGRNDLEMFIVAYDNSGAQIATSNGKSFTAETDGFFDMTNVNFTVDENTVNVTCKLTPVGVSFSNIQTYKAILTDTSSAQTFESTEINGENGNLTCSFIIPTAGTYECKFEVNGYNAAGEQVAFTNIPAVLSNILIKWDAGVDGIESESGSARYFNLQGIEVKNPAKGEILIKVQGDKTVKVINR